MKRFARTGALLATGVLLGWLSASAGVGQAAEKEKARELLEGLRQRGYHDMALEYLDEISKSARCPDDLKEVIDFEAGVTLVGGARKAGTTQARETQLDQARGRFEKFIKEHAKHALAAAANTQLANVMVERGRLQVDLANQPSKSTSEKNKLLAAARKHYQAAEKVFKEAERRVSEKAKSFPAVMDPQEEADKIAERDKARSDLLQAKLFLAGVTYEIGKTYAETSKQHKDNLTKAAEAYRTIYDHYGSLIGGLYARMWEGRVYKELGRHDQAINVMREMMTLPDEPAAFRLLKNQSMVLMLETYLLPKVKKYDDAEAAVKAWQESARGGEESSTEGLVIHYLAGVAALKRSESLKAGDPARKASRVTAKQHFEFVARFPGAHQRDARTKLMDLSGDSEGQEAEPTNYAEAKNRGDFAWGAMVVALSQVQSAGTAEARAKAAEQMGESRDEAVEYYRMALAMRTPEVPTEELNLLRFRLTYLYWAAEDYYRSAVLGEFLATRYPASAGARKGGEIAVKAYRSLFTDAAKRSQDTSFEAKRMKDIADYITTRWANEPEAQEAWMMLIDTAVDTGDLDGAVGYLEKIDTGSPQRARAELKTGQAYWRAYAAASAKVEGERPPQAELDGLVEKAQQTLKKGIDRMRKGVDAGDRPDYTLVYSVLSLAQIHVDAGQSEEAVRWLDDPKVGPMALVKADAPAVRGKEQFAEDTYKAALRAYVGAQELDKAEETMNALEKMVSADDDVEANKRLTRIYIRLGQELQDQLTRLRQEGKTDKLKRVSDGFELFLKKISEREQGTDFRSLNWVAETFFGLGAGMDPGGKKAPAEAQNYYRSAAATYLKIVQRAAADPEFAPPEADISVKVRLAKCLTALGAHQDAMNILVGILRKREKRLDVQLEAARTYQDWGEVKPGYYEYAIKGGQEYKGRYLVWGWGGIATRLAPFIDKYENTFHEARHNLAVCRQKQALTESGEKKSELLKKAKLDILRVLQLYPTMGGPEWYAKYDSLLKTIQKLLGEKATGLKGVSK